MVDRYVYLGLLLTEHLDFEKTVKYVAQSASRALGLLISKRKLVGGLPYNVYTQLFEFLICFPMDYTDFSVKSKVIISLFQTVRLSLSIFTVC